MYVCVQTMAMYVCMNVCMCTNNGYVCMYECMFVYIRECVERNISISHFYLNTCIIPGFGSLHGTHKGVKNVCEYGENEI